MHGDFEKAAEYLVKAYEAEKWNVCGILNVLHLWLRNASSDRAKFDKMFDDYANSPRHAKCKQQPAKPSRN